MQQFLETHPRFIRHIAFASAGLLVLAIVNHFSSIPIISIFPFLIPVVFIAWQYGLGWGFVIAALATLAAMPGNYAQGHDMHDLYWAAFSTYLKLTAAATGLVFGKNVVARRN